MKLSKMMTEANWIKDQQFLSFSEREWALKASEVLQKAVDTTLRIKGKCNVMLTGGKTANELYRSWSQLASFKNINNVSFYFGDERCVPMNSDNSNYAMSMATLFAEGIPKSCQVFPMYHDGKNPEMAAANYEELLPDSIDILILAFGEDGHIASIFPGSPLLNEVSHLVATSSSKNHPYPRITVTPFVIESARSIFVIAKGKSKGDLILSMISEFTPPIKTPLTLVKKATWILDDDALAGIVKYI